MKCYNLFFFLFVVTLICMFLYNVYNYNITLFINVIFFIFIIFFINKTFFLTVYYVNDIYYLNISLIFVFFLSNFIFIFNLTSTENVFFIYLNFYILLYFNIYFFIFFKFFLSPSFFNEVFIFYFNLDIFLRCKQEMYNLDTFYFSDVSNETFDFTHVFTKKNDSSSLVLNNSFTDANSSSSHQSKIDFPETQVAEISRLKDRKTIEDKIVTYNHISSMYSKESRVCLYFLPTLKMEKRLPHDLVTIDSTFNKEMHEFKHVQKIPDFLKLINYSLYYSHVTKISFLHTMENIPFKSNLERMNSQYVLDVYRYLLDSDENLVRNKCIDCCKEFLKNSKVDLKIHFNIDIREYENVTSPIRTEQIDQLFEDSKFKDYFQKNFKNFISSIDFTDRDNEEILRTISLTTSDEYKPSSFNRAIKFKFPGKAPLFENFFVENNKTLNEGSYPSLGIYPHQHSIFKN